MTIVALTLVHADFEYLCLSGSSASSCSSESALPLVLLVSPHPSSITMCLLDMFFVGQLNYTGDYYGGSYILFAWFGFYAFFIIGTFAMSLRFAFLDYPL